MITKAPLPNRGDACWPFCRSLYTHSGIYKAVSPGIFLFAFRRRAEEAYFLGLNANSRSPKVVPHSSFHALSSYKRYFNIPLKPFRRGRCGPQSSGTLPSIKVSPTVLSAVRDGDTTSGSWYSQQFDAKRIAHLLIAVLSSSSSSSPAVLGCF